MSTGGAFGILKDQPLGLVMRVRYMLEYMTLCGNPMLFDSKHTSPPQPYPVPTGVPMGIVCLPDFVVDVSLEAINNATATKSGQLEPLDVGGRAGRLAWVLHNFGGQKNGWYSVKYVAKAGDFGRVVLKRRFTQPSDFTAFEQTSLRYIVAAREDRNWLHVYGDGLAKPAESSHEGLDVTAIDVDESPHYSLIDLLVDTRYVVVSSKYTTHAVNALNLIADGLERLSRKLAGKQNVIDRIPIGILVDLSALANQDDTCRLVDSFLELKNRATAFDIESTALCRRRPEFQNAEFDYVLVREEDGVWLGNHFEQLPGIASGLVAREAFTAGYVLAASCDLGWKLLRRWYEYCPKMRPIDGRPHVKFPKCEEAMVSEGAGSDTGCDLLPSLTSRAFDAFRPSERFVFATTLARHTKSIPLSYRDLVTAISSQDYTPSNDFEKQEIAFATISKDALCAKIHGLEAHRPSLIDHLLPRFGDKNAARTLSLHLPPTELDALASSCQLRDARREMEAGKKATNQETEVGKKTIDKAVMFDLDATVLDSGGMLRASWFNGLRAFFKELDVPVTTEEIHTFIDIYKTYVYDNHEVFRQILRDLPDIPPEFQPCDFRQIWNHRYAWAALLWMLKADPLQKDSWADESWSDILESHREHVKVNHTRKGCKCTICLRLTEWFKECENSNPLETKKPQKIKKPENLGGDRLRISIRRELALPLRDQLIRFKFAVQAGRKAFWEVDYPGFSQARSCIKMIRAVPGCEVYVVTEGHEETQLQKLKCAGLSDLFPRARVLSTGAASAAEQSANDLAKLLQSHEHTKEEIDRAYRTVGKAGKKSLEPVLEILKANIESISFLKDLLSVLYEKRHIRFYSAVIDAIRRKPESPAQLLLAFVGRRDLTLRQELGGLTAMKFFMIGDRYDNDCEPLLQLGLSSGHKVGVGTCRLLSGKRAKEDCPPTLDPEDPQKVPRPTMLVCDTLAQVAHILQYERTWKRIALIDKEVMPPVLLDSREGQIHFGPVRPKKVTEPLANKFKHMSWARADKILREERALRDMLNQIEKDLAVCEPDSLVRFFKSVRKELEEWWQEADTRDGGPASILLEGALKILANVNWWRSKLQRPLLKSGDASGTLEWLLGSRLLSSANIDRLRTICGPLRWLDRRSVTSFDAQDILEAIPYSHEGLAIVTALERDPAAPYKLRRGIADWLGVAYHLEPR